MEWWSAIQGWLLKMEWWSVIQGCKEDGKNKKLNEDKKGVAMQKQRRFLSGEKELVA